MNVEQSYQVLGLTVDATLEDVKNSYRVLAKKYHPDVNPQDSRSHDKFIEINQAYNLLIKIVKPTGTRFPRTESESFASSSSSGKNAPRTRIRVQKKSKSEDRPQLTDDEKRLKQKVYWDLQKILKAQNFARAVVLLEALIQRLPKDSDVKTWLASAYQKLGSQLITRKKLGQARLYLKKALRTDPHNRRLWVQVERDFSRLEKINR